MNMFDIKIQQQVKVDYAIKIILGKKVFLHVKRTLSDRWRHTGILHRIKQMTEKRIKGF